MAEDAEAPKGVTTVSSSIDLPGDVMVEGSVMVVAYIGVDGAQRYAWATRGEFSAATGIGLLEIVKLQMAVAIL